MESTEQIPEQSTQKEENETKTNQQTPTKPAFHKQESTTMMSRSVSTEELASQNASPTVSKKKAQEFKVIKHEWKQTQNIIKANEKCAFCSKLIPLTATIAVCQRCNTVGHYTCATAIKKNNESPCNPPHKQLLFTGKDSFPLIVFVNPKSGGQQGKAVFENLVSLLGPSQVFDLMEGGPDKGLSMYRDVEQVRVLVAGGDGTVGWVLQCMDKYNFTEFPPIAVLPLGTGNDLSRSLKWGGGYTGENLLPMLKLIEMAKPVAFDRWKVSISNDEDTKVHIMNNYFSIGADASIALDFHTKREQSPELFTNRFVNKMWYAYYGTKGVFSKETRLNTIIDLVIDGELHALPDSITGLIFTNLTSYAGGTDLWGKVKPEHKFKPAAFDDGLFEVVGIRGSFEMGTITTGMNKPKKIAQAKLVKIICKKRKIPMQVDGEPWVVYGPCTIIVEKFNQARMLVNPMPSNTIMGLNVPEITVDDILKPFTTMSGFFENLVTPNKNNNNNNANGTTTTQENQQQTETNPTSTEQKPTETKPATTESTQVAETTSAPNTQTPQAST